MQERGTEIQVWRFECGVVLKAMRRGEVAWRVGAAQEEKRTKDSSLER